ncbi:phage head closure protein [Devosia algicola]|uniref:Phage head closure protein n=1 Tax=Devosia algicola TaxID=3026418 RepID=A0ABY7YN58_9HYPH|nr:phage head closure protein [Devosia algicola]WDR02750.1 phage head closure protein [Devosia algicola]
MSERIPAIGTLTDRVQLKRKDMSLEDAGGIATLLVPLATVWARVRRLSGRASRSADGQAVVVSHSVVLRYRNDIGAGDRIIYRGRNLEVISTADINGRRAYLSCLCSEIQMIG